MRRSIRYSLQLQFLAVAVLVLLLAGFGYGSVLPLLEDAWSALCRGERPALACTRPDLAAFWTLNIVGLLLAVVTGSLLASVLVRRRARDLQLELLAVQKGHRDKLSGDAPYELRGLVQQINRVLTARPPACEPRLQDASLSPAAHDSPTAPATPADLQPEALTAPPHRLEEPVSDPLPPARKPTLSPPKPTPSRTRKATADMTSADETRPLYQRSASTVTALPAAGPGSGGTPKQPAGAEGVPDKRSLPVKQIQAQIELMKRRYSGKQFELISDLDDGFSWPTRAADLDEVLGNLLDNAGRWAQAQVNVYLASKSNVLALEVTDDGPGVTPEQLDHLGTPGLTLNHTAAGKGLGLATVRYIIGQYGGGLAFSLSRLGGLEVLATLPATRPALHSLGDELRQGKDSGNRVH